MGIKWAGRFNFRHSGGSGKSRGQGVEQGRGLRGQQTTRRRFLSLSHVHGWLRDSWPTTKKSSTTHFITNFVVRIVELIQHLLV